MSDTAKYALIALGGYALFNYAKGRSLLYVPSGIVKNNLAPGRAPPTYNPATSNGNTNNLINQGFDFLGKIGGKVIDNLGTWTRDKSNIAPDTTDVPSGWAGADDSYNNTSDDSPYVSASWD